MTSPNPFRIITYVNGKQRSDHQACSPVFTTVLRVPPSLKNLWRTLFCRLELKIEVSCEDTVLLNKINEHTREAALVAALVDQED